MADDRREERRRYDPLTRIVIRWGINAVALWVAIQLIPGITVDDASAGTILLIALVFGLVNALIRPVVILLSCPLLILTLGLGTLLINAAMFSLTAWLSQQFGLGFVIDGFWPAFFGALVATIVSAVLSGLVGEKD